MNGLNEARLSTSSVPGGAVPPTPSNAATTERDAQEWSSIVLNYSLRLEHVALDISTDRILFHLECELEQPIPAPHVALCEYICLGWPLGGIWKIAKIGGADNRFLTCVAWKKTELTPEDVAELAKKYTPLANRMIRRSSTGGHRSNRMLQSDAASVTFASTDASANADALDMVGAMQPPALTLFDWRLQLGTYERANHWFVQEVGIPPAVQEKAPDARIPEDTLLVARLLVGFAPIEVSMVVNAVTAVDTVAQSFTADVTWELTFPGLTTMREDSALRELLDLFEFKEDDLEFSNATDVHSERPLMTLLEPAGRVTYVDPFLSPQQAEADLMPTPVAPTTQRIYHLKYLRRVTADFNEEMSLYYFPFDQQKLTFTFNMGRSVRASLGIAPPSGDAPGRFALETFKLGNVFDVVFGDKLFIGDVVDSGANKSIRFEMMLERQSGYYLTNVVVPAAIITYLCFISYATQRNEAGEDELMDTGSRLQVVVTLVLTNVTFKYNLASLLPQVSYFTTIDKYVFVCFIITAVVTFENALFPLLVSYLPGPTEDYSEKWMLWATNYGFTLLNIVWGLSLLAWVKMRNYRSRVLLRVNEYVRIIAKAIPNADKERVLRAYLTKLRIRPWAVPTLATTKRGDLFVKLPSDSPTEERAKSPHEPTSGLFRKQALRELPAIQTFYSDLVAQDARAAAAAASPGYQPGWTHAANSPVRGGGVTTPTRSGGTTATAASATSGTAPVVDGVAAVVAREYGASNAASVVVNVNVQEDPPVAPTTPYAAYKSQ